MKAETPNPNTIVWFQNRFVPLGEANVNILTHALNYGTGVFEGIRGYWDDSDQELYMLRLLEHYERWKRNCGVLRIQRSPHRGGVMQSDAGTLPTEWIPDECLRAADSV